MMGSVGYSTLWQAIIRPPRAEYSIEDFGPQEFDFQHVSIVRTDLEVTSPRKNYRIMCSHFEPSESTRQWDELPCVIYMHGNSSCRLESASVVPLLLSAGMTVFCFDFAGCGKSDGEYISLGWWERDDLNHIVNYLRS